MKRRFHSLAQVLAAALATTIASSAPPAVTNLSAVQRPGTKLVDITFDVSAPGVGVGYVSLEISSDGGTTWNVPSTSASGYVGPGVPLQSGSQIVWDAGTDWGGNFSSQMRFRVIVDDWVPPGFVAIPGGIFTMGRTSADTDNNAPPVTVTISSYTCYMSVTETTKAAWDEVRTWAIANGYTDLPAGAGKGPDHPVHSVSWFDVVKWCNARSEKEGLTPCYTVSGSVMRTGSAQPTANWNVNGFRLPTEAEWEYAARGGVNGKRYPWGTDTISHAEANFRNSGGETYQMGTTEFHPTYEIGSYPYTSPVGSFAANGFGLRDMSGNVWEWCWDWYAVGTYSNGATDPRGPASGTYRGLRGGSWEGYANYARAAFRSYGTPPSAGNNIGFRTARSSVP